MRKGTKTFRVVVCVLCLGCSSAGAVASFPNTTLPVYSYRRALWPNRVRGPENADRLIGWQTAERKIRLCREREMALWGSVEA